MTELSIPFQDDMICAVMRPINPKTQTRRTNGLKEINQAPDDWTLVDVGYEGKRFGAKFSHRDGTVKFIPCPYGEPKGNLWVREAWQYHPDYPEHCHRAVYRADPVSKYDVVRWRPSIHMFRWASRIDIEKLDIRIERLQDISEADAISEGCRPNPGLHGDDDMAVSFTSDAFDKHNGRMGSVAMPVCRYAVLYESINGPGSWEANPYLWVVTFKRVKP